MRKSILELLNKMPLKDIFIFESSPDFGDNTYWLFKYLAEQTDVLQNTKCVWFVGNVQKSRKELCGIPIVCVDLISKGLVARFKRLYYTWFAKLIVDCNRYIYKKRNEQIRIYLTHGMPLKIPANYIKNIGDCDLLPVSATLFTDFFAQYVNVDSIKVCGLPRNDVFKMTPPSNEKFIIWMPTYRQHKASTNGRINNIFPLGIPVLKNNDEIDQLDLFLQQNDIRLLIRPHPSQDLSVLRISNKRNIIIADDGYLERINEPLYILIAQSAALITDYSSVYYDYLLLNRPIGLTIEDIESFSEKWPLYISNNEIDMPGIRLLSIYDLERFIEDVIAGVDDARSSRQAFIDRNGVVDTNACEMIADYIEDSLKL